MPPPPTLILFDINGVLYRYHKPTRIAHLSRLTARPPAQIEAAIWGSGFEDQGDAGALDAATYLRGFAERLGAPIDLPAWRDAVQAALTPLPDMLALTASLAPRVRIAALTNNNLLVRDQLDALFPALRPLFGPAIHVSAEFSRRKPDPAIYHQCLARLGAHPGQTLFIDDSAENVRGAEQAGLRGHLHTDPAAWRARLCSLGLL